MLQVVAVGKMSVKASRKVLSRTFEVKAPRYPNRCLVVYSRDAIEELLSCQGLGSQPVVAAL